MVANTLGDLTRRECRFAHPTGDNVFPFDARRWSWRFTIGAGYYILSTLPTLHECSSSSWNIGSRLPPTPASSYPTINTLDFWTNDNTHQLLDTAFLNSSESDGNRIADDVILTNVIGFDVNAWDSLAPVLHDSSLNRMILPGDPSYVLPPTGTLSIVGYGAYVDLGFYQTYADALFSTSGVKVDRTIANPNGYLHRVYDTWSTHYESVGASGPAGRATNGFDDAGNTNTGAPIAANGIVDDAEEKIASPPYPVPLRGIQVKIRVFEPDSRQIREVTVVQDFLPQ